VQQGQNQAIEVEIRYAAAKKLYSILCTITTLLLSTLALLQAAGSSAQAGKAAETNPDTAAAAASAARASTSGRPEAFKVVRTFSWQEKVYSKAELVAAQVRPQRERLCS
jgi:hypothetical protein